MCGPTFVSSLYFALRQKSYYTSLSDKRIILLIFYKFFLHNNPYNQRWWCEVTNIRNKLCKKWALIFKALPTDHKIKIMGKKLELTCECWVVCFKAKSLGAQPSFQWRQLIPTWFNTPGVEGGQNKFIYYQKYLFGVQKSLCFDLFSQTMSLFSCCLWDVLFLYLRYSTTESTKLDVITYVVSS